MSAAGGLESVSQVVGGNWGPATGYCHSGPALTAGGGAEEDRHSPPGGKEPPYGNNPTVPHMKIFGFYLSYSVNMYFYLIQIITLSLCTICCCNYTKFLLQE